MKETNKSFWDKLAQTQNNSCCSPKTEQKPKEAPLETVVKKEDQEKKGKENSTQNNCCS